MKSKKLICLLSVLVVPAFLLAQSDPLDKLLNKYGDKPGFRYAEMETNMLACGSENSSGDLEVKFISYHQDSTSGYLVSEIYNVFSKKIKSQDYEPLAILKRNGNKAEMMINRQGPVISGIVVMMMAENHALFLSATGEFNLKEIVRLKDIIESKVPEIMNKFCRD